jgi:regulatory protein
MHSKKREPSDTHANYSQVRVAALDLLAYREHSQAELIGKLRRRFQESIVIEEVVEQLQAENLQSDERYTETLVRYYGEGGKGPNYIRRELVIRGVCELIINEYLQDQDEYWLERIEQVSKKKYHFPPVDLQERAKRFRFFQSRGFTSEQIQYVLDFH